MRIQDQVSNADLSNKIKKLGVITPSLYFREWTGAKDSEVESWGKGESFYGIDNVNCYTVAELGELLPYRIVYKDELFNIRSSKINDGLDKYLISLMYCISRGRYARDGGIDKSIQNISEANARAKMLCYLIEQGLLKNEKI